MADILLAEDDRNCRTVIGMQLRLRGHQVREAANAAEALAEVAAAVPEVCIVDLMMPEVDGFTLCEQLRARPDTARVPVMALSALDELTYRPRAVQAGFDDYLEKPFLVAELHGRVRSLLSGGGGAA